jgi:hypothetical protein
MTVELAIVLPAFWVEHRNVGGELECYIVEHDGDAVTSKHHILLNKMRALLVREFNSLKGVLRQISACSPMGNDGWFSL